MTDTPFDVEEFLAEATPREAVARVCSRQDLLARHAELEAELTEAHQGDLRENREPESPRIAQQIVDLEAEIAGTEREFRFRAIGRRAWADLLAKYPPTKDQQRAHPGLDHNPDRFPVAAIAASAVAPTLTVDQAKLLEERLNLAQWEKLWGACLDANLGGSDRPLSVAAGMTLRASGGSGTTAASEGSLAASSSDE